MKVFWVALLLLASTVAKAQDIPPLAPLRGDVASLVDTMNFIQEKLPGTVNYMLYGHNSITGADDSPLKATFALTQVSADAGHCSISFHSTFDRQGNKSILEKDGKILLKQVQEISLTQLETVVQQSNATAGHPERSYRVDPPIVLVTVKSAPDQMTRFNFYDQSLAERVSLALKHAVSLCGGGKPETF
jgi:hypothetical protein